MRARMASRCGAILGASHRRVTSTLEMRAAARAHAARGIGQEQVRGGALPALVGVGKMLADIAVADGAEQGVGERMQGRRRRRSGPRSAWVWGMLHAAQPDMVARGEAVHVEALAGADVRAAADGRAVGHGQVLRRRELAVGFAARHQLDRQARPIRPRRHRRSGPCWPAAAAARARPEMSAKRKPCGVCARHRPARSSVAAMRLRRARPLEGVGERHRGNGAGCMLKRRRARGR